MEHRYCHGAEDRYPYLSSRLVRSASMGEVRHVSSTGRDETTIYTGQDALRLPSRVFSMQCQSNTDFGRLSNTNPITLWPVHFRHTPRCLRRIPDYLLLARQIFTKIRLLPSQRSDSGPVSHSPDIASFWKRYQRRFLPNSRPLAKTDCEILRKFKKVMENLRYWFRKWRGIPKLECMNASSHSCCTIGSSWRFSLFHGQRGQL